MFFAKIENYESYLIFSYTEETRFTILLSQGLVHLVLSLHCLGVLKYLNQCHCTGWRYLNIYIGVTALAGGI